MNLGFNIAKLRALAHSEGLGRIAKTLIVGGVTYCLSMIMTQPLSFSLGAVSSMSSTDFSITDMYQLVADGRAVHTLSPNIVIVDVNNCSRDQIAETIELTKLCEPKAIGVDVSFVEQREGDEPLVQSFSNADNIVCAEMLESSKQADAASRFDVKYRSWFADSLGDGVTFAAANFPTLGHGGTMRNFKPWFEMADGTETPSFATALAMKADPKSVEHLRQRGKETEAIYYPSVEFKTLMPGELYDRGEELTGKVVLLGALNDPGDLHRTPLDSHTSGTLIQAYALNTVLNGQYLEQSPAWIPELVAFLITFIFIFTSLSIKTGVRGLLLRLMQVTVLYLVLYAGYWFFIERNVVIDFSRSFLMLAFALFAVDIWNGVYYLWLKGVKTVKKQKNSEDITVTTCKQTT